MACEHTLPSDMGYGMGVTSDFNMAADELPTCCDFDPLKHKTLEDLLWLARIELDLHEEDQDGCCTKGEAQQLRRFIKKWQPKTNVVFDVKGGGK